MVIVLDPFNRAQRWLPHIYEVMQKCMAAIMQAVTLSRVMCVASEWLAVVEHSGTHG